MVHPVLFTMLMLFFTVAMLIKNALNRRDAEGLHRFGSNPSLSPHKSFLNSILTVALVYTVTHTAGFVYLVLVWAGYEKAGVAEQARQVINCVSMLANFFIYLIFSKKYRVTLKKILLEMG